MIPGASVRVSAPWRPATRLITRSVYSSSSLVPVSTWSTIETAAITSAASSASPNESIPSTSGKSSSVSIRAPASANSTSRKPETSVNGSRRAASSGGRTALTTAITAATRKAPPGSSIETPATSPAAM